MAPPTPTHMEVQQHQILHLIRQIQAKLVMGQHIQQESIQQRSRLLIIKDLDQAFRKRRTLSK